MAEMKIECVLDEGAFIPEKAHESDAGYDLRAPKEWKVLPGEQTVLFTGVHVAIPEGYYGKLESKSGLMTKHKVTCPGGVIDSGYTGSIAVALRNDGEETYHFHKGDKVVQLIILKHESPEFTRVMKLTKTERGSNGFGSTGR